MNLSRLLLVSLLICPSLQADNLPPVDENVQALRVLEQQLGAGRLADAERQLQGLQQRIPGDTRLQGARRLLALADMPAMSSSDTAAALASATTSSIRARSPVLIAHSAESPPLRRQGRAAWPLARGQ